MIILKECGIIDPLSQDRKRGDHIATIEVEVPTSLNEDALKKLRAYSEVEPIIDDN